MSGIVLYGPAVAPFTEKVARALALKKLDYQLVEPQGPEDYRRWNPETGLLPVLDVDGERIPDSTQILLRLDELYPEPALLSPDPKVAAAQRRLEDWADESFYWYWTRYQKILQSQGDEASPSGEGARPRGGLRKLWARLRPERPERFVVGEVTHRLDDLVGMLGDRPYFQSDTPSMGDIAVYAMLVSIRRGSFPGAERELSRRPALVDFMRRIEQVT